MCLPAALVLLLAAGVGRAPAEPLIVSAAVSLTDVLTELATAYAEAGGGPVSFNFAGSNTLARQIVSGAPVDVYVSADAAQMAIVERAGLVAPGTRAAVARNALVLVVRPGSAIGGPSDLVRPAVRRVALGDPAAVPAGVYARQYLERVGLWEAIEAKVVPTAHVRAALVAVQQGAVDAAFVYATDARTARGTRVAATIAGEAGPSIVYPAAVMSKARRSAEARRFLEFLRGPIARQIFERHGFLAPEPVAGAGPR